MFFSSYFISISLMYVCLSGMLPSLFLFEEKQKNIIFLILFYSSLTAALEVIVHMDLKNLSQVSSTNADLKLPNTHMINYFVLRRHQLYFNL